MVFLAPRKLDPTVALTAMYSRTNPFYQISVPVP